MTQRIYIRTELQVAGLAPTIHVAELEEVVDARDGNVNAGTEKKSVCKMVRIIEIAGKRGAEIIVGAGFAGDPEGSYGLAAEPEELVPHPDTYVDFPDVAVEYLDSGKFDQFWEMAVQKFPQLNRP